MAKLSENLTPAHGDPIRDNTSTNPQQYGTEQLGSVATTRAQQVGAVTAVMRRIPESPERGVVLEMLFRRPYRTPPNHKQRTHEKVVRYNAAGGAS